MKQRKKSLSDTLLRAPRKRIQGVRLKLRSNAACHKVELKVIKHRFSLRAYIKHITLCFHINIMIMSCSWKL
ncbi:CLUMA_CG016905, isoform A [Clunio marinus]|uniref:CLUMA_CG016905, isoform A n=1 Tax=Clunio marinus TaxID=568069 RepID=A0A1J1ISN0_9DIPT|nr:CLUMA_CG016905, isoform A [Clunio marinus]